MMNNESDEIDLERHINQQGLYEFVDNLQGNSFSEAVFEQIEKLQKELSNKIDDYVKNHGEDYIDDAYSLSLDTEFLERKLSALSEMNIVFAYKDFEINFKKLIGAAYGVNQKEFYKWDVIINFLKSKGMELSKLEGYKEINDLRNINNHIKHSTSKKIDNKIKNIAEFSTLEYLDSDSLILFFNRIKNFPYKFLQSVSSEIYKNLYVFDANRLKSMAKEMALRMDRKSAELFIQQLEKLY